MPMGIVANPLCGSKQILLCNLLLIVQIDVVLCIEDFFTHTVVSIKKASLFFCYIFLDKGSLHSLVSQCSVWKLSFLILWCILSLYTCTLYI